MNLPLAQSSGAPSGPSRFRHVAIVGKYHALGSRDALERIAHFLHEQGCEVAIEQETAQNTGLNHHQVLDVPGIGAHCDLALVMGGDGTMLGIGRQMAQFNVPLVGINQGRLGFITDIPFHDFETHLQPILRGEYEEDHRSLMHAGVWRDPRALLDDTVSSRLFTATVAGRREAVAAFWAARGQDELMSSWATAVVRARSPTA